MEWIKDAIGVAAIFIALPALIWFWGVALGIAQ
jgi:hypothetical protein